MNDVSETEESTTALRVLLQVGAAGGVGALVLPIAPFFVTGIGWAGGGLAALIACALVIAVVFALLMAVAGIAPGASSMTGTREGRLRWALIVAVLGTGSWGVAFSVCAEAGPDGNPMATLPFSAVPYALAATLLLRQWYLKACALVLTAASGFGLVVVLAGTVPDELAAQLAEAHVNRDEVFVVDIPGYHRLPRQSVMRPDDPQAIPPDRDITLYAYPDDPAGDCVPSSYDLTATSPCVVERPGLAYTAGVVDHQYVHRKGTVLLRVVGSHAVGRDLLRAAVLAARPAAEPGVYTTDIDGYVAGPAATTGARFLVADVTERPFATDVTVSASPGSTEGECADFRKNAPEHSPYVECVDERPGLYYRRMADKHLYLTRHGSLQVTVTGGLGVDRAVLRDAALSARRATDDELTAMLPPATPPPTTTFMDRARIWAKELVG